jgi:hypothetical protein
MWPQVYETNEAMKGAFPGWDKDIHFVVSHDMFKTQKRLVACGNQFEVLGSQIFMALPNNCPVGPDGKKRAVPPGGELTVTLYVSQDEAQSFVAACIPTPWLDRVRSVRLQSGIAVCLVLHAKEDQVHAVGLRGSRRHGASGVHPVGPAWPAEQDAGSLFGSLSVFLARRGRSLSFLVDRASLC